MKETHFSIRYKRKVLYLRNRTAIMGVLNVTPDSFSDGGLYYANAAAALKRARQMLGEGADIIDIGGESTRPGASLVSEEEELKRVIPVIKQVRRLGKDFFISIDTRRARVAEEALRSGADMVNSLSGFDFDKNLVKVVCRFKCPIVVYHIKGTPKTMQRGAIRYKDVIADISRFFKMQIRIAKANGVSKNQLIIDPGVGFGKTPEQNVELIRRLKEFSNLDLPIAVGVSRKSHLGIILQKELKLDYIPGALDRLEPALAETAIAVIGGANIVRTHDVGQTKRFLVMLDKILKG